MARTCASICSREDPPLGTAALGVRAVVLRERVAVAGGLLERRLVHAVPVREPGDQRAEVPQRGGEGLQHLDVPVTDGVDLRVQPGGKPVGREGKAAERARQRLADFEVLARRGLQRLPGRRLEPDVQELRHVSGGSSVRDAPGSSSG
jgi:hypothetical protein